MYRLPALIPFTDVHHFDIELISNRIKVRILIGQLKLPATQGFLMTHSGILDYIDHNHLFHQLFDAKHHHPRVDLSRKPFPPNLERQMFTFFHQFVGRNTARINVFPTKITSYTHGDTNTLMLIRNILTKLFDENYHQKILKSGVALGITGIPDVLASGTISTRDDGTKHYGLISARLGLDHVSVEQDVYLVQRRTGDLVKQIIRHQPVAYHLDKFGKRHSKSVRRDLQMQPKISSDHSKQLGSYLRQLSEHSLLPVSVNWMLTSSGQLLLDF